MITWLYNWQHLAEALAFENLLRSVLQTDKDGDHFIGDAELNVLSYRLEQIEGVPFTAQELCTQFNRWTTKNLRTLVDCVRTLYIEKRREQVLAKATNQTERSPRNLGAHLLWNDKLGYGVKVWWFDICSSVPCNTCWYNIFHSSGDRQDWRFLNGGKINSFRFLTLSVYVSNQRALHASALRAICTRNREQMFFQTRLIWSKDIEVIRFLMFTSNYTELVTALSQFFSNHSFLWTWWFCVWPANEPW